MKASRKTLCMILTVLLASNFCPGQASQVSIPEGTKIQVRLEQDLSGETAQEGQAVQLSVMEDVVIDGVTAIAKGANVTGKVVLAQPKRRMGRTGKIDFSIERVTAADQSRIELRYTLNKKEGGSQAVATGVITAGVAIAFFPAAPFILLMRGKEAKIDKGTIFEVFTDQTHTLSSFAKTDMRNSQIDIASDPIGADVEVNGDFVGSTPLAINLPDGEYEIVMKKRGFATWSRKLKVAGANVGVNAELEPETVATTIAPVAAEPAPAGRPETPAKPAPPQASVAAPVAAEPVPTGRPETPAKPAPPQTTAGSTTGKPAEQQKTEPARSDSATVMFENESHTIHLGSVGKDEAGKTSIELLGVSGRIPLRNGELLPPVGMKIVVNGKTLDFQGVNISDARHIFHFDTTAAPEKIIVYGNDGSDSSSAVFDGKTRRLETGPSAAAKTSASPKATAVKPPEIAGAAKAESTPSASASAAKSYDARKGTHDIVDLIENKIVEVEIQGSDITEVSMRIRRLVDYPVTALVPVGSFFVSSNTAAQNMVATAERRTTLNSDAWQTISVAAACANRPKDIPDSGDRFTVQRSPQQKELAALMPVLDKANANMATRQAAVWIVTDDADYDDLGILISFPGNSRVIGYEAAARAMRICSDAGIAITKKSIWSDRNTILSNLPDGALKTWLQTFG